MTALADGDREAFHPIFVRLWPLLRGFARRHLPPPDADDAAQTGLLKVFSRASEFDPRRDALSWILGIAAWEIRTVRRRQHRRREVAGETLGDRPADARTPEEELVEADLQSAVRAALDELSPSDVETLTLFARDERPPGATFRKRLERALGRLRHRFRGLDDL